MLTESGVPAAIHDGAFSTYKPPNYYLAINGYNGWILTTDTYDPLAISHYQSLIHHYQTNGLTNISINHSQH